MTPGTARRGSGRGSALRGFQSPGSISVEAPAEAPWGRGCVARSANPTAQSQKHRVLGTLPKIQHFLCDRQKPGGQRTTSALLPQANQISSPAPIASRPLQTEISIITAGDESRAPGLATSIVVLPTGASQEEKTPLSLTVASPDKQLKHLSLSPAPGRELSISPNANT